MEIQHLFDNLLQSIDWDKAAEDSYTSFHARGLSYLNLLRTDRLTVKLYAFNNVKHNAQDFLVHPHTHAYNFTHRTMAGKITNHKFTVAEGNDWNVYSFQTPLNGGTGLTKMMSCGLGGAGMSLLPPGRSYYLSHDEIHTLSVKTNYAAALLLQFHDVAPGGPTVMFAPADEDPDCSSDLYYKMSAHTGRQMIERYKDALNGGEEDEADVF